MQLQFVSLDDVRDIVEGLVVEELEVEEIELRTAGPDPRLEACSPRTQAVIRTRFGGSFDEALATATRVADLFSPPPAWALELVAPRKPQGGRSPA